MGNVSDKIYRENQNKISTFNTVPENRAVYEMMWKDMVEHSRTGRR